MSKPEWKDALEWANWLAQDGHHEEHTYVWFENKPKHDGINA